MTYLLRTKLNRPRLSRTLVHRPALVQRINQGLDGYLTLISAPAGFGLTGERSWALTILMTVAFTTVVALIVDLDRSQSGLLQVSQQPLIDLLNKIGTPAP